MAILQFTLDVAGQIDVNPRRGKMICTDDLTTIQTAGFLNDQSLGQPVKATDIFDIIYDYDSTAGAGTYGQFTTSISSGIITLTLGSGSVVLPTTAGNIAFFANDKGALEDLLIKPSNASKVRLASIADAAIGFIPHFTDVNGTIGQDVGAVSNRGSINAGLSGTAGSLISFPSTAAKGSLALTGVANTGDTLTAVSNAAMGQASVISIPDPGAATANFLLDTGAANIITDYQQFVSLDSILMQTAGTWTVTRGSAADYYTTKAAAAETAIIGIAITPQIRLAASKGFKLASVDVIYAIGTLALVAHSATLSRAAYVNNAGITITSIPLTGSLAIATQGSLYVTNLPVATPAFLNTAISKYIIEVTVQSAATSTYLFYGLNLHFSTTIG